MPDTPTPQPTPESMPPDQRSPAPSSTDTDAADSPGRTAPAGAAAPDTGGLSAEELARRLAFAADLAAEAGRLTLDWFDRPGLRVETKADGSPVTEADRAAERLIRDRLAEAYPGEPIVGEEFGGPADPAGPAGDADTAAFAGTPTWSIDPIDGTKSFMRGVPLYGTLLACVIDHRPVVGTIAMPALGVDANGRRGELYSAARGLGAWRRIGAADPVPIRVSDTKRLAEAMLVTTSTDYFTQTGTADSYTRLTGATAAARGWSDCYAAVLVASGRADLVVEPPCLQSWDIAAPIVLIEEAGGRVTGWRGDPVGLGPALVASNGRLHEELLGLLTPPTLPTPQTPPPTTPTPPR